MAQKAVRKTRKLAAVSLELEPEVKKAVDEIARQEKRSVAFLGREAFDLLLRDRREKAIA